LVIGFEPLAPPYLARVVELWRRVAEEVDVDRRLGGGAELSQLLAQLIGVEHRAWNGAEPAPTRYLRREHKIHRARHRAEEDRMFDLEEIKNSAVGPHVGPFRL